MKVGGRFFLLLALFAGCNLVASSQDNGPDQVWTGIVYTWYLQADGTYKEDGVYASTDEPAQGTLTGTWHRNGSTLSMDQDSLGFAFKGSAMQGWLSGDLFYRGLKVSVFCAQRGTEPPQTCVAESLTS